MKAKRMLGKMIDKTYKAMKDDKQMQKALWKWQSRFMYRGHPPQEILKAGSEAEEDEDNINMTTTTV